MKRGSSRRGGDFRRLIGLGIVLALVFLVAGGSGQVAPARAEGPGETVFQSKCASCHRIGGGNLVGPDLSGVTAKRSHDWLVSWIMDPNQLLAKGDATAKELVKQFPVQMPSLGLSQADAEAVIQYIDAQSAAPGKPSTAANPAAQAAPLLAGDPARGKEYFTGVRAFQNGGPPCMACHSVAGVGALGGGALGPDLTPAYNKYGDAGLASVLANIQFPTMRPIFGAHPLTPAEQADLKGFLQQAAVTERPTGMVGQLAALGVAWTVAVLALAHLYWRRRLTAVRRPLVRRGA